MNECPTSRNLKILKGTGKCGDMEYSRTFKSLLNNNNKYLNRAYDVPGIIHHTVVNLLLTKILGDRTTIFLLLTRKKLRYRAVM